MEFHLTEGSLLVQLLECFVKNNSNDLVTIRGLVKNDDYHITIETLYNDIAVICELNTDCFPDFRVMTSNFSVSFHAREFLLDAKSALNVRSNGPSVDYPLVTFQSCNDNNFESVTITYKNGSTGFTYVGAEKNPYVCIAVTQPTNAYHRITQIRSEDFSRYCNDIITNNSTSFICTNDELEFINNLVSLSEFCEIHTYGNLHSTKFLINGSNGCIRVYCPPK